MRIGEFISNQFLFMFIFYLDILWKTLAGKSKWITLYMRWGTQWDKFSRATQYDQVLWINFTLAPGFFKSNVLSDKEHSTNVYSHQWLPLWNILNESSNCAITYITGTNDCSVDIYFHAGESLAPEASPRVCDSALLWDYRGSTTLKMYIPTKL